MANKQNDRLNAIQMLEEQHRLVEKCFEDLARQADGHDPRAKLYEVAELLTTHAAIEERHFYPAVRAEDTQHLVDDSYEDHLEVKRLLLHLLDAGPKDAEFQVKLEELQGLVESHVQEEETELFPAVRELMSADQLEGLAQEMTATMVELEEEGEEPQERLAVELGDESRA